MKQIISLSFVIEAEEGDMDTEQLDILNERIIEFAETHNALAMGSMCLTTHDELDSREENNG